ncbi:MAG: hypothetical protein LBP56_06665 [Odoribacteraceae bacterium]|jgi:hypothetical protein|nr:hypothetical protein [Odoribacteraceae bacterium]
MFFLSSSSVAIPLLLTLLFLVGFPCLAGGTAGEGEALPVATGRENTPAACPTRYVCHADDLAAGEQGRHDPRPGERARFPLPIPDETRRGTPPDDAGKPGGGASYRLFSRPPPLG